jgi:hypothetical protein
MARQYNYSLEFKMTRKGINVLTKAIEISNQDVYGDYDLHLITEEIEQLLKGDRRKEVSKLSTTQEVIKSIEWLKKNRLV